MIPGRSIGTSWLSHATFPRSPAVLAGALCGVLAFGSTRPAAAQEADAQPPETPAAAEAPAQQRALDIGRLFASDPTGYEDVFAPDFLQQVPSATLDQIFSGYHAEHGGAQRVEIIGPFAGGVTVVRYHFEDGSAAILQMNVEPSEPHRVTGALIGPSFVIDESASGGGGYRIGAASYPLDTYETKTALRLPFGGEWWVFWGGRNIEGNYHRADARQRYAYDFVIRRDGSTHAGAGKANEDYWCEGEPVVAPAAGTVVRAVDEVPENVPGQMNADQKLGNHVVIDHGNGEFSLLAHLRTGSVSVEAAEHVTAGARIGACGNSGNSTEPHLHYQLQTGPDFFESESVPAPFHDYVADGELVESGEPERGQAVAPAAD